MRFEFTTAGRIVFGQGTLREAGEIVAGFGARPLVVTGSQPERARPLLALLAERGCRAPQFAVAGEPTVMTVRRATTRAREEQCDCIIGFGGGAALDTAKAVAVLVTNAGDVLDYFGDHRPGQGPLGAPTPAPGHPDHGG